MAKIVTVSFRLEGKKPLLMNPMSDDAKEDIEKGRQSVKQKMTAKELAATRVIRDDQGRPGLRDDHLYECLVCAGREVPWKGLKMFTPSKQGVPSKIYSFLELKDSFFPLQNGHPGEEPTWSTDKRPTPTDTGKRTISIRPRFELPWAIEGIALIDTTDVGVQKVKEVFVKAGRMFGLGSYRGRFGLFRVAKFETLETKEVED
jgi:hypothetical protein